jgi:hypothetical protein
VRAGIAASLIDADFTSAQQRLVEIAKGQRATTSESRQVPILPAFTATERQPDSDGFPFNVQEHLELVDTVGRCMRGHNRGADTSGTYLRDIP